MKTTTFNKMIQTVIDWNHIAGNDVKDDALKDLYMKLAREEMFGTDELMQGWLTNDPEKIMDGVGDLIYTYGFLCALEHGGVPEFEPQDDVGNVKESLVDVARSLIISKPDINKLYVLLTYMSEIMDVEGVFDTITTSNMSKFPLVDDVSCPYKELEKIQSQGRYDDISFIEFDGRYVFFADKDIKAGVIFDEPKIVKPSQFQEPEDLIKYWV